MELEFQNFQSEYELYKDNRELVFTRTASAQIFSEYETLDVKMRLAFGISEIILNNTFVSDKEGDLKACHLLYYKLADLWFAYETYIKFYKAATGQTKKKIVWLNENVYEQYSASAPIENALNQVREGFAITYNTPNRRTELNNYLRGCEQKAAISQKARLTSIIDNITNSNFNFTHTKALTIIYAIRNNFVHNGETTVVPDMFGFTNKVRLLRILYPYLSLVILKSTNITCRNL